MIAKLGTIGGHLALLVDKQIVVMATNKTRSYLSLVKSICLGEEVALLAEYVTFFTVFHL